METPFDQQQRLWSGGVSSLRRAGSLVRNHCARSELMAGHLAEGLEHLYD